LENSVELENRQGFLGTTDVAWALSPGTVQHRGKKVFVLRSIGPGGGMKAKPTAGRRLGIITENVSEVLSFRTKG